jgi:transposase-like protein
MTIDSLAVLALLNDDKFALEDLMQVTRVLIGQLCPICDSENVESNSDGSDLQCADCESYTDVQEWAGYRLPEIRDEINARSGRRD